MDRERTWQTAGHGGAAEYTGLFEPGGDPIDEQALEDWKDLDKATRGPRPSVATLDGRVSFSMGQHPGETGLCELLSGVDRSTACGYITILDDVRARSPALPHGLCACTCVPSRARPSP